MKLDRRSFLAGTGAIVAAAGVSSDSAEERMKGKFSDITVETDGESLRVSCDCEKLYKHDPV